MRESIQERNDDDQFCNHFSNLRDTLRTNLKKFSRVTLEFIAFKRNESTKKAIPVSIVHFSFERSIKAPNQNFHN